MYKSVLILYAVSIVVLSLGCDRKQRAIGNDHEVLVVADSSVFTAVQPQLSKALERVVRTPWPEKQFELVFTENRDLARATVRHNIIMIGMLDATDATSNQVKQMLNTEVKERIRSGEGYLFRKQDAWASGQLLLVLASTSTEELGRKINENSDYLFELLRGNLFRRTEKEMYANFEQVDIEKDLLEKYGWRIRVQHDYHFYQEIPQNNFVHFRRTSPERWLFVHWFEGADPSVVTDEAWFFKKRNLIGRMHYEGDVIVDTLYTFGETEIAGRWAMTFQGLWENTVDSTKMSGGPVKSFMFYDENTNRAYIIDTAVFAPGKRKEPYLRQLETMARTFRTKADLEQAKGTE